MKTNKGKKRNIADALYAKKSKVIAKKVNPFELHRNKEKFNVLNRKTTHSHGKPLVSRQLAIDKRKQTIGVEYKLKNKANIFQDNRKTGFKVPKQSIYNLNDAEVLTHRGQTLSEIERYDDVVPEEEEMSDDEMRLDAKFTEAAHFGGGDGEDRRDRKTVIEELIADSKKRKIERTRENEYIVDMTEKLDSEWRELIPVVNKLQELERDKPEQDDYDRLVREMIFAPRGEPTEKLKNEEEIAKIEKGRLEKLERERLQRMKAEDNEEDGAVQQPKHRSADDLDDGYFLESPEDGADDNKVLSYAINPDRNDEQQVNYEENGEVNIEKNGNTPDEDSDEESQTYESAGNDESGSDEESVDSLDDLKVDSGDEEEQLEEAPKVVNDETSKKQPAVVQEPLLSKKQSEALEKIPFTIAMPLSYEKLSELLETQSPKIQGIIVDRIIKTNHPRLLHVNRNKMLKLFAYVLQYVNDLFSNINEDNISKQFKILHEMNPFLFDLIQMNPEEGSKCFLEVLKEKYEEFKLNPKRVPKLDTLVFFKLIGALFPTSDFRHPIVTPSYVFLHHILSQSKVKNRSDVAAGLFLVTLVLDYQQMSKKFLPAVMNFLTGICYLGVRKSMIVKLRPVPPFKKNDILLVLENEFRDEEILTKLKSEDFLEDSIDEEFKVRALNTSVNLIVDFVQLYDELIGLKYFLDPFETVLNRLADEEFLPSTLRESIREALDGFERIRLSKKFVFPAPEKKVQPMIRLLEPRFDTVLSDRRTMFSNDTGPKAEQKKLKHMIKREYKSAKRELRRDNEFLSKIRHKRKQDLDTERKAKVKRIFNEASVQQSEFNALSRTKGRKNKF